MPKLLYHFLLVLPANHFQNVVLPLYFQANVLFSLVLYCNEHLSLFLYLSIWISSFSLSMLGESPILWSKACLPYRNWKSQKLNFPVSLTSRAHSVSSASWMYLHWLIQVVQRGRTELANSNFQRKEQGKVPGCGRAAGNLSWTMTFSTVHGEFPSKGCAAYSGGQDGCSKQWDWECVSLVLSLVPLEPALPACIR